MQSYTELQKQKHRYITMLNAAYLGGVNGDIIHGLETRLRDILKDIKAMPKHYKQMAISPVKIRKTDYKQLYVIYQLYAFDNFIDNWKDVKNVTNYHLDYCLQKAIAASKRNPAYQDYLIRLHKKINT